MKFDKPKIQTSHEPLVRLLAEMESLIADRAKMRMRLEGVKAEVANKLAKLEPDDEEGLKVVSAKRTQLDIFPHSIKRLDERIEKLQAPLVDAATAFENGLKSELREFAERRRQAIAAELEPLFPWKDVSAGMTTRVVDDVAAKAKPVTDLLQLADRIDASRHAEVASAPDWEAQLPQAVRELLAMANEAAEL